MRDIKFRAWDNVQQVMEYSGQYPSMWQFFRHLENIGKRHWEVMQYTGLHDYKGCEVYEGDIVTYYGDQATVIYDNELVAFSLQGIEVWNCYFGKYGNGKIEVIGNIHETPELVGAK